MTDAHYRIPENRHEELYDIMHEIFVEVFKQPTPARQEKIAHLTYEYMNLVRDYLPVLRVHRNCELIRNNHLQESNSAAVNAVLNLKEYITEQVSGDHS